MTLALHVLLLVSGASAAQAREDAPGKPTGFIIGAQAEFIGPIQGVSGALVGYDFGRAQLETSLGARIGTDDTVTDVYVAGARLHYLAHETERADLSLSAGGTLGWTVAADGELDLTGLVVFGARIRVFMASNVAMTGALGVGALLRGEGSFVALAARPMGSAGFLYYFP